MIVTIIQDPNHGPSPPKFDGVRVGRRHTAGKKNHKNPFITFWVVVPTNEQTDQRYWKDNLLNEGSEKIKTGDNNNSNKGNYGGDEEKIQV